MIETLTPADAILGLAVGGLAGERVIGALVRMVRHQLRPDKLIRDQLAPNDGASLVDRTERIEGRLDGIDQRVQSLESGQRDILGRLVDLAGRGKR